jgi:ABC-2 type transport system permease protein
MSSPRARRHMAAPRAAFGNIVLNEARLAWRTPIGLVFGVGLPALLVVIFGELPSFNHHKANLGGLTEFNLYVPILIGLAIAAVALFSLPVALVSYREQGILRRLSTTPVPPSWVLAAQVAINLFLAVIALLIVVIVGVAAFGEIAPRSIGALVLAFLLSASAIFAIGLTIAAQARTAGAAGAIGNATFFPLMFFGGLWLPRAQMPPGLRDVSDYTPLGAAVQALQDAIQGTFPPATTLLTLAAYAGVLGYLATRYFKWE